MIALAAGDILHGWTFRPESAVPLVVAAVVYVHAARLVRFRRGPHAWRAGRTVSFLAGLGVAFAALASPIDGYSDRLLSVHMVQHMLLMMVAPPLLLLGRPITLALAASSTATRHRLHAVSTGAVARAVGHPFVCFGLFAVVLWAAHVSPLYEATLTDRPLHILEHVVFLSAAMLFWWPVVARDPGSARLSHPARLLYLFLAMPVMSLLGFVISSSKRVLYLHYLVVARVGALADQRLAGTLMWEGSMLVSAIALSAVFLDWMRREEQRAVRADALRDRARMSAA